MPAVSPVRAVRLDGFAGGLNKDADVTRLEQTESPEILNGLLGIRGEVFKRQGYERYDDNLAQQVTHMVSWRDASARVWLVAIDESGDVFYVQDTGDTFTDSAKDVGAGGSSTRHPIGWAVANGFLYLSSRRGHTTMKWNGTTWSDVAAVPKAQFLTWRFEQLFAANIVGAPSQLQVSLELAPEDFTTEPAIFEFDPDDGEEIRGIAPSGDDLLVFKDHTIHLFTGKVRSDFARYRLDSLRGTFSPRTIKQVRGLLVFLDRDTGVWAWDGATFTLISEKINQYLLNGMTYDHAYIANAHVRRDLYILSVPWEGSSVNQRTFVYSTLSNSWTEWDYGAWDSINHANRELIASPRGNVGVWEYGTYLDDAAPISFHFKTPWLQPAGLGGQSRLRRVETNFKASGSEVDVLLRQEYSDDTIMTRTFETHDINSANEVAVVIALDGWPNRADTFQLEYVNDSEEEFQLNLIELLFTVNRDRLGEHTAIASATP